MSLTTISGKNLADSFGEIYNKQPFSIKILKSYFLRSKVSYDKSRNKYLLNKKKKKKEITYHLTS